MNNKQASRVYFAIFALLMIIILGEIINSLVEMIEIGFLPERNLFITTTVILIFLIRIVLVWLVIYIIWIRNSKEESEQ
jgi:hypothetical protein